MLDAQRSSCSVQRRLRPCLFRRHSQAIPCLCAPVSLRLCPKGFPRRFAPRSLHRRRYRIMYYCSCSRSSCSGVAGAHCHYHRLVTPGCHRCETGMCGGGAHSAGRGSLSCGCSADWTANGVDVRKHGSASQPGRAGLVVRRSVAVRGDICAVAGLDFLFFPRGRRPLRRSVAVPQRHKCSAGTMQITMT